MSLVLNMVGGGSGLSATDALLCVQSTAGSIVTITKDTVTKTAQGHENALDPSIYDYYFVITASEFDSVNPWTATSTLGVGISSDTIIVDAPNAYSLTLTPLVPAAYQAVEYIRGTGAAYTKLDFTTPAQCGFELDALLNASSAYQNLFGGAVYNQSSLLQYFEISNRKYNPKNGSSVTYPSVFSARHKYYYKYNGSSYDYGYDNSLTGTSNLVPEQDAQIAIFTYCEPNGSLRTQNIATASIYNMKYFSGFDEYANLIPCYRKSDSVSGLFETHRETFYSSYSSTNFIVGEDIK